MFVLVFVHIVGGEQYLELLAFNLLEYVQCPKLSCDNASGA